MLPLIPPHSAMVVLPGSSRAMLHALITVFTFITDTWDEHVPSQDGQPWDGMGYQCHSLRKGTWPALCMFVYAWERNTYVEDMYIYMYIIIYVYIYYHILSNIHMNHMNVHWE